MISTTTVPQYRNTAIQYPNCQLIWFWVASAWQYPLHYHASVYPAGTGQFSLLGTQFITRLHCALQHWCRDRVENPSAPSLLSAGLMFISKKVMISTTTPAHVEYVVSFYLLKQAQQGFGCCGWCLSSPKWQTLPKLCGMQGAATPIFAVTNEAPPETFRCKAAQILCEHQLFLLRTYCGPKSPLVRSAIYDLSMAKARLQGAPSCSWPSQFCFEFVLFTYHNFSWSGGQPQIPSSGHCNPGQCGTGHTLSVSFALPCILMLGLFRSHRRQERHQQLTEAPPPAWTEAIQLITMLCNQTLPTPTPAAAATNIISAKQEHTPEMRRKNLAPPFAKIARTFHAVFVVVSCALRNVLRIGWVVGSPFSAWFVTSLRLTSGTKRQDACRKGVCNPGSQMAAYPPPHERIAPF